MKHFAIALIAASAMANHDSGLGNHGGLDHHGNLDLKVRYNGGDKTVSLSHE